MCASTNKFNAKFRCYNIVTLFFFFFVNSSSILISYSTTITNYLKFFNGSVLTFLRFVTLPFLWWRPFFLRLL